MGFTLGFADGHSTKEMGSCPPDGSSFGAVFLACLGRKLSLGFSLGLVKQSEYRLTVRESS